MKKVILFYLEGCPYCISARKAISELKQEYPPYVTIPIQRIEENQHPEIAGKYDYHYCPTFYVDDEKIYECSPADDYDTIKKHVREVLDKAL
jgi:glutaredoxin